MRKRNLLPFIDQLALTRRKMAFISGPRQVGKTTLAKMLKGKAKGLYGNWDELEFRRAWTKSPKALAGALPRTPIQFFPTPSQSLAQGENRKAREGRPARFEPSSRVKPH
ncbi:MAG: hypothetical protein OXB88_04240 [Bacteriovoracales bacterium]|nr:hypothetical protein [Bacteriovoracales bacterium]